MLNIVFLGEIFIPVWTEWAQNSESILPIPESSGMEWIPRRIAEASHFETDHLRDTCCSFLSFVVVLIHMTEQVFTPAVTAS